MARRGLVPCVSIGEAVLLETAHEGHRETWVQVLERDRYLLTGRPSEMTKWVVWEGGRVCGGGVVYVVPGLSR